MIYLNWCGPCGRETVDEIDVSDYKSRREAMGYAKTLVSEYVTAGMDVYTSSRACGDWND